MGSEPTGVSTVTTPLVGPSVVSIDDLSMKHYERANSGERVRLGEIARAHLKWRRGWSRRVLVTFTLSLVVALATWVLAPTSLLYPIALSVCLGICVSVLLIASGDVFMVVVEYRDLDRVTRLDGSAAQAAGAGAPIALTASRYGVT